MKDNKIAIILFLIILFAVPTWFTYQDENFAWLVTDASRLIRISIAVIGLYYLTNSYHLKVAILGYFVATLTNVTTVFLSDGFVDMYRQGLFYTRLIMLFLSGIFFATYLWNVAKIYFTNGANN